MSREKKRLEYLRRELRAERISTEELLELESLQRHIEPGDVELLEAAGVPENYNELLEAIDELQKNELASIVEDIDTAATAETHADVIANLKSALENVNGLAKSLSALLAETAQ